MIVPSIGLDGQVVLSSSSVLVVGAGGIGSTVLLYLAGHECNWYCLRHVLAISFISKQHVTTACLLDRVDSSHRLTVSRFIDHLTAVLLQTSLSVAAASVLFESLFFDVESEAIWEIIADEGNRLSLNIGFVYFRSGSRAYRSVGLWHSRGIKSSQVTQRNVGSNTPTDTDTVESKSTVTDKVT